MKRIKRDGICCIEGRSFSDGLRRRHDKWKHGASLLTYISISLEAQAYGLGRLDCALIEKGRLYLDVCDDGAAYEWHQEIFDHRIQSYLWLLGAYELVRTLGQNLRQVPKLGSDDLRTQVEDAKRSLARPRMLVAKHEPMHSKVKEDEPMTCLNITFTRPDGIYFLSGPGKIDVSRKELADKLLSLLSNWPQSIKKQFKDFPLGYLNKR